MAEQYHFTCKNVTGTLDPLCMQAIAGKEYICFRLEKIGECSDSWRVVKKNVDDDNLFHKVYERFEYLDKYGPLLFLSGPRVDNLKISENRYKENSVIVAELGKNFGESIMSYNESMIGKMFDDL